MDEKQREYIQKLERRFGELKTRRAIYEQSWMEIAKLFFPMRSNWTDSEIPIKDDMVYDSTGKLALNLMANGFAGYIVTPNLKWFYADPTADVENLPGIREWFEAIRDHVLRKMANSNFYLQMHEMIRDAGSIATATMWIKERLTDGKLTFQTLHPKQIYIDENHDKEITTVFRRFFMTKDEVVQQFGCYPPEWEYSVLNDDNMDVKVEVRHAVELDKNYKTGKNFSSVYYLPGLDYMLEKKGFFQNPYIVWRYAVNSDEVYGYGPAHDVLSEVRSAQEIRKTQMQAAQLGTNPPKMIPNELKGIARLTPGGHNYYDKPDRLISSIQMASNYPLSVDQIQHVIQMIKEAFNADFFLMLQNAPPNRTATEVMEMQGEKAAILSITTTRMMQEALIPIIHRVIQIESDAGRLPLPPGDVKYDWKQIVRVMKIEFTGILPMLQKRTSTMQVYNQTLQSLGGMMQILGPQVMDYFDGDAAVQEVLKMSGVTAKTIRDDLTVKKMRKDKAAQQQQMIAQQQQAELQKTVAGKMDPNAKPQDGSPMAQIQGQMAAAMGGMNGQ